MTAVQKMIPLVMAIPVQRSFGGMSREEMGEEKHQQQEKGRDSHEAADDRSDGPQPGRIAARRKMLRLRPAMCVVVVSAR